MAFSQNNITISQAIEGYWGVIERARSPNTLKTHQNALPLEETKRPLLISSIKTL